ncbi:MAG: hypothetical protein ACRYG7_27995 [Janthinobacterium lividum]
MKPFTILASALLLAPLGLLAQKAPAAKSAKPAATATKPAAKPASKPAAPAAKAATPAATASAADAAAAAPTAPIALAPVTPAPDPNALKIKAEQNPIAHTLTVRCDAPGPTRFEINDKEGRPVLTKNVMVGTTPVVLSVASLPTGPYVVRCTAGEKKGMRLVQLSN